MTVFQAFEIFVGAAAFGRLFYLWGYKAGGHNARKSPFNPDSFCGVCGRQERYHNSCPSSLAQKR